MRERKNNVELKPRFTQACDWEATIVGADKIEDFVAFMANDFGVRIQYLEEIVTGPEIKNGRGVPDTGGRSDVFFAVHDDDVDKFAMKPLAYGIRWVDDVLAAENYASEIYPNRVFGYC